MMLSEIQKERVNRLVYDLDETADRVREASQLAFAAELHEFVGMYNWDDGFEIPRAVADNRACEFATALKMFWLSGAVEWLGRDDEPSENELPWYQFSKLLSHRLLSGYYARGYLEYAPAINRAQKAQWLKQGAPALLLEPAKPRDH